MSGPRVDTSADTHTLYGMLTSLGKFDQDPIELDIKKFSDLQMEKAKALGPQMQHVYLCRVKGCKEALEQERAQLASSNLNSKEICLRIQELSSKFCSSLKKHYTYLTYQRDLQAAEVQSKECGQRIKQAQVNFPVFTMLKRQSVPVRSDAEKQIDAVAEEWRQGAHAFNRGCDRETYDKEVGLRVNKLYMEVEGLVEQGYNSDLSDRLIQIRIDEYRDELKNKF